MSFSARGLCVLGVAFFFAVALARWPRSVWYTVLASFTRIRVDRYGKLREAALSERGPRLRPIACSYL